MLWPRALSVAGQLPGSPEYLIDVWDTDSGLPHSTVTSIAQTPDGYLWVGTQLGGLARFDGVRFVTFHPGNTAALQSLEVRQLLVDPGGTLWVGMVDGHLLSRRQGSFHLESQQLPTPLSWIHSLIFSRSNEVMISSFGGWLFHGRSQSGTNRWETFIAPDGDSLSAFCEDPEGRIWYRTRDAWLGVFANQQFSRMPTNCGLAGLVINALTRDAEGRIWVGTDREIAVWDGRQFINMTPTNGEPEIVVRQLVFTDDRGLWVRDETRLRKCLGRAWVAAAAPWDGHFQPAVKPLEMYGGAQGGIWVVHYSDGIWHVDRSGRVARISHKEGLPANHVESWFQDREGNIWAGLSGGGLVRLRRRTFQQVWPGESLPERAARSVCEDAAGAMWFGTSGDVFLRWQEGQFSTLVPPVETTSGRDGTVCLDAAGRVWLGTVLNGAWVLETNGLRRPFPASAIGTVVRALFADRAGRVWIGNEFGLYCWENGALKTFSAQEGFGPGLVYAITEGKDGTLWFGTAEGELRQFKGGRFVTYRPQDRFGATRFWALLADHDGVVWIGTLGGGLLRFEEGQFVRYTMRDGLPNEHVSQILEAQRGDLWLGTRAGIARVRKIDLDQFARGETKSVPFVTYGKFDGLPSVECSGGYQPGCWRSRNGSLWFTTAKGVVSVKPKDIPFNPWPPPVVIEEVLVEGKVHSPAVESRRPEAANGAKFAPHRPCLPRVEMGPGRHYLEIHFTGLSFIAPDKVQFKYRMEGVDPGWVEAGNQRLAIYNFIPPGEYRFRVLACNNDGVWNEEGATLALEVRPYFWQTLWFKILGGILLVGGSGGAIGFYERRKARRKLERVQQQRALERERARIAKDIHDDLGANLTRITLLSDSVRSDLGDTAQAEVHLDRISATARDLTRAMDEIVWAVNPKHDRLDSLVNYLGKFAQDFLSSAGIAYRSEMPIQLPHWPLDSQVRHNLFLAFKEALHNAVKHAAAKEVHVSLTLRKEAFVLTVRDNGCGFRRDDLASSADPALSRLSTGNGLVNMKNRMEGIGGHCELQSKPGAGTVVRFVVRLRHPEK
ncbi:MAG TPA: two-component regulator propeller domain-containing protein [Verrucomicrobiota bacterium]|nr:MAG: Sensor histidine kinase DesK [Verrucomicrobia bacterium ADurb.Bin063]HPW91450.1 two-component regulator propeller domain-containing protein [Verrucomicrobiota bacterium]